MLTFNVAGTPAPQGSKRAFVVNGRPVMTESSSKVKPWRQDVTATIRDLIDAPHTSTPDLPLTGPVRIFVTCNSPSDRMHRMRTHREAS